MNRRAVLSIGAILQILIALSLLGCQIKPKTVTPKKELAKKQKETKDQTSANKDQKEVAPNKAEVEQNETETGTTEEDTGESSKTLLPTKNTPDEKQDEPKAETSEEKPKLAELILPKKEDEPKVQPRVEEEQPQTTPQETGPPKDKASARLDQYIREKTLVERQEDDYIANLLEISKNKITNLEYNEAKFYLDEILTRRPGHQEANKLRVEVGSYLGEVENQVGNLFNQYSEEAKIKMQQAKLEARNNYSEGEKALAQNDYDRAINRFERCIEIIKWAPYQLDLDDLRQQAQSKIDEANANKEKWIAQEQQRKREEARKEAEALEAREQARLKTQIEILLSRAMEYFTNRQYGQAQTLTAQVLEIDPRNKVATKLQEDIRQAEFAYVSEETLKNKIEGWKRFLNDIRVAAIPSTTLIEYPSKEYWHGRVVPRQSRGSLSQGEKEEEEDSPEVRKIKNTLASRKIEWNFVDTPFQEVITYIRSTDSINIVIDPDVIDSFETDESSKVTLQLRDLYLKEALNILLEFNNLTYIFKDEVLYIVKRDSDLAKAKSVPRLHDIRDLTGRVKDFPGPNIKLGEAQEEGAGTGAVFTEDDEGSQTTLTDEKLIELIKSSIAPNTWEEEGEYSIAKTSGQLLVVHTEAVQEEIAVFLNDLRKFSGLMVSVESRFLEVTDDFLERVGVDWRGIGQDELRTTNPQNVIIPSLAGTTATRSTGSIDNTATNLNTSNTGAQNSPSAGAFFRDEFDESVNNIASQIDLRGRTENIDEANYGDNRLKPLGGLGAQFAFLDELNLNTVLSAVKKSARDELLMAPRLTAFNTQRASVTVVQQRAYIRDFDVEVAQGAYLADPVIGTLQTGTVLDVRPIVSNDRKYVTLEMRPTVAAVVGDETVRTGLGGPNNATVEINVPELRLQSVEATVRVPDRGSLMIGGLKSFNQADRKQEVPLLGSIPVISFFFSQKTKVDEKRDLLILVTATIIDLDEEEEKAVGASK